MAKTNKKVGTKRSKLEGVRKAKARVDARKRATAIARAQEQAAEWTPARLRSAVTEGTLEQKLSVLRRIGIVDEDGKLSKRATDWGSRPTHTPPLEDLLPSQPGDLAR